MLPISVAPDHQRVPAVAAALLAALLFGTTGTILVNAPHGADAYSVGFLRLAVGGVTLFAIARRRPPTRVVPLHLLGAFGVAVFQCGYFVAVERTGVAVGTVVTIGSGPALAGVIESVRRRCLPTLPWLAGMAVSVAGVALLGISGRATEVDLAGIALGVLAGLGWATFSASGKHLIDSGHDSTYTMAVFFSGGAVLMAPWLATHSPAWAWSPNGALVAGLLGVATVGVAYTSYGWALRHLPAPTVITLTLLEPITATTLAAVVVHEGIRPAGWGGIALVLAGLVVTARAAVRAVPASTVGP